MDSYKKNALIILLFLFISLLVLRPVWQYPNRFFKLNNDFSGFVLPNFKFFKDMILEEKYLPLWQNKYLSGYPLLGDPQTILLYPLNYLSLFMDIEFYFLFYFLFHLFLAGVSVYFLVRIVFKLTVKASVIAGIIYVFSPKLMAHIEAGHPNLLASYAYVPLVLLLYFQLLKKPTIIKTILLGFTAAMVYILYLTTFYYLLLLLIGLTFYQLFLNKKQSVKRTFIYFGLSIILFLGFILPELLASIELWPQLARNLLQFSDIAGPSFAWRQYIGFLLNPLTVGSINTEMVLYLGFPVTILALIGFTSIKLNNKILIITILCVCFFYAIGSKIPFYAIFFRYLPGVNLFRVPSRMWFIVTLFFAILGGYGLDLILEKRKGRVLALFIIVLITGEYLYLSNLRLTMSSSTDDLAISKDLQTIMLNNETNYFRLYCTQQCLSFSDIKKPIVSVTGGYNPVQLNNYFWFFQKAGGFRFASYAPALPPYQTFADKPQPDAAKQGILGVRYVLTPYLLTDKNFRLEKTSDDLYLYRNNLELPRIYLKKDDQIIPLNAVIDRPGFIFLNLDGKQNGKVVLSEIYTTAWKVYKDGKKEKVTEEDNIIISSKINNNKELIFSYEPLGHPYSWYILIITYILSLVLITKSLKNK